MRRPLLGRLALVGATLAALGVAALIMWKIASLFAGLVALVLFGLFSVGFGLPPGAAIGP